MKRALLLIYFVYAFARIHSIKYLIDMARDSESEDDTSDSDSDELESNSASEVLDSGEINEQKFYSDPEDMDRLSNIFDRSDSVFNRI
jgi:hypothetical protein